MHIMLADSSGDAAVTKWTRGEMKVIPRQGMALFMTNSMLAKPETAGGPKSRYNRAMRLITYVARSVKRGELHLVYRRHFDYPRVVKLSEQLAKSAHEVDLNVLFPNPIPFERAGVTRMAQSRRSACLDLRPRDKLN